VIAFMCSSSVFWGTIGWLPSYLLNTRGFAFKELGFLAALPYILGTITVLVFGAVADKVKYRAIFPTIALLGAALFIYLGATVETT
jgi:sugar phosphate permease